MRINEHGWLQAAAVAALFAITPILTSGLRAQAPEGPDTSSSTTEDSTGKVTGYVANRTITVDSRRGPFTYRLGRDMHVVGPDGKSMKPSGVKVGEKVTVYYYMRDGAETVARIAVLAEAPPKSK
jgi:hypothetical protein